MKAIMTRSALIFWGHNPAPNVASVVIEVDGSRRVVTWGELMEKKRTDQRRHLEEIRHVPTLRPARLWVGYNPNFIYQGWFAVIDNLRQEKCVWSKSPRLIPDLMRLFPLVIQFGNQRNDFQIWCAEFARQYQRGTCGGKPRGFTIIHWNGSEEISK